MDNKNGNFWPSFARISSTSFAFAAICSTLACFVEFAGIVGNAAESRIRLRDSVMSWNTCSGDKQSISKLAPWLWQSSLSRRVKFLQENKRNFLIHRIATVSRQIQKVYSRCGKPVGDCCKSFSRCVTCVEHLDFVLRDQVQLCKFQHCCKIKQVAESCQDDSDLLVAPPIDNSNSSMIATQVDSDARNDNFANPVCTTWIQVELQLTKWLLSRKFAAHFQVYG